MTSSPLRNTHQEYNSSPLQEAKSRETSIKSNTSFTADTDFSSPMQDPNDRIASRAKVRDLAEDILRVAVDHLDVSVCKVSQRSRGPSRGTIDSFVMDPVDQYQCVDKTKSHLLRRRENDLVQCSVEEVKGMVLEEIPKDVRNMISTDNWDQIFKDATESFCSQEIARLQNTTTKDDIEDIISFISVYVQREVRGGRLQNDLGKVSETSNNEGRPKPVDAMTLVLESISASVTVHDDDRSLNSAASHRMSAKASNDDFVKPESRTKSDREAQHVAAVTSASKVSKPVRPESIPRSLIKASKERSIRFSRVDVRYYEQILSDNPAVTTGPPIGIGWRYRTIKNNLSVDAWEHRQKPHRRYLTALATSRHERTSMLYDLKYTQKDIAIAIRDVLRIKNMRKQTVNNLRFESMEEMIERTTRRIKNALTFGMADRQKKKLFVSCQKN